MTSTLRQIQWRAVLTGIGALFVLSTLLSFVLPSPWPVMLALIGAVLLTNRLAKERKALHSVVMVFGYVVVGIVLLFGVSALLSALGY